jgi:ATP-dependent DNA ligase I
MSDPTLFSELADVSAKVANTRSRLAKKRFLVELLARIPRDEKAAAVGWLVAEPPCGPVGVGPAQLWELSRLPILAGPPTTLHTVDVALDQTRHVPKAETFGRLAALFETLTELERAFLAGALTGSLRQGSLGGVMLLALAELSGKTEADVRRAVLLTGSIVAATKALLEGDERQAAAAAAILLFRPLAPMLASSAESIEEALALCPNSLVEWKVDGIRAQVHKKGRRIAIYSRQGHDITAGCAPVVDALASIEADEAVLDGEVVLLGPDDRPRPFQDSFSAVASKGMVRVGDRLTVVLFDCLYRDGIELLNEPLSTRVSALRAIVPGSLCMTTLHAGSLDQAKRFAADALAAGHEGVMVKDLAAPYSLGARGRAWQKVKEFATADLVVLAAEWGSGRRKGWLSNLHLGARRDDGFCMVGKTFKGLTDDLLRWQTVELETLVVQRSAHIVYVRPALVVEIRFNEVQRSRRYPGGVALRFARVVRYRQDKAANEADTLSSLVARLPAPEDGSGKSSGQLQLF